MKTGETALFEVRILDDGLLQARRKDRTKLTDDDIQEARRWADSQPGITVDDVLRVFPGARVLSDKEVQSLRQERAGKCPTCGKPWTPYEAGKIVLHVCWCEVKGKWITEPWKKEQAA